MSFTLVIKFSREYCLKPFFDAFSKLKFDRPECNLILINNSSNTLITGYFLNLPLEYSRAYKSIHVIQTNNPNFERGDPDWEKDVPHPFTTWTGYNSFQMIKLISEIVKDDIHIQLEDDSLPHPDAITHLLKIMKESPKCACAVTPIVNRDVYKKTSCMQAYSVIEKRGEFITRRLSMDPKLTGIHEIAATSYATIAFRKKPFVQAVKYVKNLTCKIQKSGSDVYFTNYLFEQGHKILLDYDCWNIHIDRNRTYKKEDCVIWDIIWNDTLKRNIVKIA